MDGTITFENNVGAGTAVALQAESLGQILLTQSSRLIFTNNSARYMILLRSSKIKEININLLFICFFSLGAAVFIKGLYVPQLFGRLFRNSLCTFLFDTDDMYSSALNISVRKQFLSEIGIIVSYESQLRMKLFQLMIKNGNQK